MRAPTHSPLLPRNARPGGRGVRLWRTPMGRARQPVRSDARLASPATHTRAGACARAPGDTRPGQVPARGLCALRLRLHLACICPCRIIRAFSGGAPATHATRNARLGPNARPGHWYRACVGARGAIYTRGRDGSRTWRARRAGASGREARVGERASPRDVASRRSARIPSGARTAAPRPPREVTPVDSGVASHRVGTRSGGRGSARLRRPALQCTRRVRGGCLLPACRRGSMPVRPCGRVFILARLP
ncbi:hypothetical protein HYPSUDRAFT_634396 [Hypholoma sublateritium FD-334 SS-4]|uniref:Uncharacterized protein n=1 Tax=Hypholoma sublateritium (strain FD-334 SS-4) TaxID=945553 RepID=A0A0D2QBM1_HYPSF|nr:hypothetical protein HYPSUDRAFT_634396 [Hypholoma sublateritium FD-334 SS-4]